jgi:putative tricarboxylic transport membrane protein
MDALIHLGNGFLQVLQPANLLVLFIGLVLGMLVAVLPGLTLVMGVVSWRCPSPTPWNCCRPSSC